MNKRSTVLMLTMTGLLAACNSAQTLADQDETQIKEVPSDKIQLQPAPSTIVEQELVGPAPGSQTTVGPGLQRLVDLAIKDLTAKQGIDAAKVELVQAEYVTWRDSSLGCPRPGDQYMQVLTNGSRILLRADKRVYYYHSGKNRLPFKCEKPSPLKPLPYAPGEA